MPKNDLTAFSARIFVSQQDHIKIFEIENWFLSRIKRVKITNHNNFECRMDLGKNKIKISKDNLTWNPIYFGGDYYMALLTYENSCKKVVRSLLVTRYIEKYVFMISLATIRYNIYYIHRYAIHLSNEMREQGQQVLIC